MQGSEEAKVPLFLPTNFQDIRSGYQTPNCCSPALSYQKALCFESCSFRIGTILRLASDLRRLLRIVARAQSDLDRSIIKLYYHISSSSSHKTHPCLSFPFLIKNSELQFLSLRRRDILLHVFPFPFPPVPYARCLPGCDGKVRWYYHFMSSVVQCQTEAEEEIVIET